MIFSPRVFLDSAENRHRTCLYDPGPGFCVQTIRRSTAEARRKGRVKRVVKTMAVNEGKEKRKGPLECLSPRYNFRRRGRSDDGDSSSSAAIKSVRRKRAAPPAAPERRCNKQPTRHRVAGVYPRGEGIPVRISTTYPYIYIYILFISLHATRPYANGGETVATHRVSFLSPVFGRSNRWPWTFFCRSQTELFFRIA